MQVLFGEPPHTFHLEVDKLAAKCPADRDELKRRRRRRRRTTRKNRARRLIERQQKEEEEEEGRKRMLLLEQVWTAVEDYLWYEDGQEEAEEAVAVQLYKLDPGQT